MSDTYSCTSRSPVATRVNVRASNATVVDVGAGEVVGTPLYMAPEACRGEGGAPGDVWGVGLICVQLLCGRVPYNKASQKKTGCFLIWACQFLYIDAMPRSGESGRLSFFI